MSCSKGKIASHIDDYVHIIQAKKATPILHLGWRPYSSEWEVASTNITHIKWTERSLSSLMWIRPACATKYVSFTPRSAYGSDPQGFRFYSWRALPMIQAWGPAFEAQITQSWKKLKDTEAASRLILKSVSLTRFRKQVNLPDQMIIMHHLFKAAMHLGTRPPVSVFTHVALFLHIASDITAPGSHKRLLWNHASKLLVTISTESTWDSNARDCSREFGMLVFWCHDCDY